MNLKERAARDFGKHITKNNGVGCDISFSSPSNSETATIKGIAMSHSMSYDIDGRVLDTRFTWITFREQDLIDAGYTVRNTRGDVVLKSHKVSFVSALGTNIIGAIQTVDPDDVFGVIRCNVINS